MGYDLDMVKIKKKSYDALQKEVPGVDVITAYEQTLYAYLHTDEYDIPEGEEAEYILYESIPVFKGCLEQGIKIVVDKEKYMELMGFLEGELKSKTLLDLVDDSEMLDKTRVFVEAYKSMRDTVIDWENEIVILTDC